MPTYNWANLSDHDFELVSRDVMSEIIQGRVEVFTKGRDGGIDLRHQAGKKLLLGQAKHYLGSGYNKLLSEAKKERKKLDAMRVKPSRYFLFTTVGLTPHRKSELKETLKPFVKSEADLFGLDEMESVIRDSSTIERNNYKLWLASVDVLQRILTNAVLTRSELRVEDLMRRARLFVQHDEYTKAATILRNEHNLIVSGPAGIGKTTLAEMFALRFLSRGYEVTFASDVNDLESSLKPESKQLFIYDDFLGRTNLQEAPPASDQERLFTFMRHIAQAKGKYLIMTTREYIYNEAIVSRERLRQNRADIIKCVLGVGGYSKINRARILYNHLYWAPGISRDDLESFAKGRGYMRIIDHDDFNPRFIADTINRLAPRRADDDGEDPWI